MWPCLSLPSVFVCFGRGWCLVVKWKLLLVKALWPPDLNHPPNVKAADPLTRSKLQLGLDFICYHLSDSVHLRNWLALCTMGDCSRSSNPSGSLLPGTAVTRTSLAACVTVWQPPGEMVGKRGENTIKMSCISTDQSLPNSHVLGLTWLSDKWRLEEKRWWKWHWSHKENSAFILFGFFCVMSDCSVSWRSNTHIAIFVLTLVVWSRLAATIWITVFVLPISLENNNLMTRSIQGHSRRWGSPNELNWLALKYDQCFSGGH